MVQQVTLSYDEDAVSYTHLDVYKRQAYLSPESIGRLKEIAADIGLSQAETARWFVEHMIALYDAGLRPETEVAVVRRRIKRN